MCPGEKNYKILGTYTASVQGDGLLPLLTPAFWRHQVLGLSRVLCTYQSFEDNSLPTSQPHSKSYLLSMLHCNCGRGDAVAARAPPQRLFS